MKVNFVVVVDPAFDGGKGCVRVGDGIDADVISLEGFDECLRFGASARQRAT